MIARIGGVVIIAFDLFTLGILKIRWLYYGPGDAATPWGWASRFCSSAWG